MAKISTILTLSFLILGFLAISSTDATSVFNGPIEEVDGESIMLHNIYHHKEKFIKFRVYVLDLPSGPNATVFDVAEASVTKDSTVMFGLVRVFDNKMTNGTGPDAVEIGRAQSLMAFADMNEFSCVMNLHFHFTKGKFNGSTLSIVGRNPLMTSTGREMPVVGGTGAFRMVRGYSISNTLTDGFIEYIFYVYYYEYEQKKSA